MLPAEGGCIGEKTLCWEDTVDTVATEVLDSFRGRLRTIGWEPTEMGLWVLVDCSPAYMGYEEYEAYDCSGGGGDDMMGCATLK
jgi:hypothetical protein